MRSIYLFFLPVFMVGSALASADEKKEEMEGFDYNRGKLEGRATIAGRVAELEITGDAAEAMYYQISAPVEVDVGCTIGETKRFRGLSCTKLPANIKTTSRYQCWVYLNLKTGNTRFSGEACPDTEYYDPYWDARGNKGPRVPDFIDRDGE